MEAYWLASGHHSSCFPPPPPPLLGKTVTAEHLITIFVAIMTLPWVVLKRKELVFLGEYIQFTDQALLSKQHFTPKLLLQIYSPSLGLL